MCNTAFYVFFLCQVCSRKQERLQESFYANNIFLLIEYAARRVCFLPLLPFPSTILLCREEGCGGEKELSDILGRGQNPEYNSLQLSSRSVSWLSSWQMEVRQKKQGSYGRKQRGRLFFFLYSVPHMTKASMENLSCDR